MPIADVKPKVDFRLGINISAHMNLTTLSNYWTLLAV